jgi:uncharacterized protein (TIGR00369 family)
VTAAGGFWDYLGLRIESADADGAVVRMDVPDALMSPFGTVHGGIVAALFDTALAVAVARRLDAADRIATHALQVTYVAFTTARVLRCRTRAVSVRRGIATAEGDVVADDGTLVAKALATFGLRRANEGA